MEPGGSLHAEFVRTVPPQCEIFLSKSSNCYFRFDITVFWAKRIDTSEITEQNLTSMLQPKANGTRLKGCMGMTYYAIDKIIT